MLHPPPKNYIISSAFSYNFKLALTQVKCAEVCKFPADKNLLILQMCNQLNSKYRWTTWSASSAGVVSAEIDMEATEETAPELLFHYLCRIHNIIDNAYSTLMKAIYA